MIMLVTQYWFLAIPVVVSFGGFERLFESHFLADDALSFLRICDSVFRQQCAVPTNDTMGVAGYVAKFAPYACHYCFVHDVTHG